MSGALRWTLLLLVACSGCSGDDTQTPSGFGGATAASSSVAHASGAGAGGAAAASSTTGAGGACLGGDSTKVETTPEKKCADTPALDGTKPVGACCTLAEDCAPTCCSCSGSATQYLAVDCDTGACADAAKTCAATVSDGCT